MFNNLQVLNVSVVVLLSTPYDSDVISMTYNVPGKRVSMYECFSSPATTTDRFCWSAPLRFLRLASSASKATAAGVRLVLPDADDDEAEPELPTGSESDWYQTSRYLSTRPEGLSQDSVTLVESTSGVRRATGFGSVIIIKYNNAIDPRC